MAVPNTSATGGYLAPAVNPAPLEGALLNAFIGDVIVGITALPGQMVRPAGGAQPEMPNEPDYGTNWCAFRISRRVNDWNAFINHDPGATLQDGSDLLYTHQNIDILCSFYSDTQDNADQCAELLALGLQIPQNREQLQLADWGLIECTEALPVPSLAKERWLYRSDTTMRFRRGMTRVYPVLNLLSAQVTIITDEPPLEIVVNVTPPA